MWIFVNTVQYVHQRRWRRCLVFPFYVLSCSRPNQRNVKGCLLLSQSLTRPYFEIAPFENCFFILSSIFLSLFFFQDHLWSAEHFWKGEQFGMLLIFFFFFTGITWVYNNFLVSSTNFWESAQKITHFH